MNRRSFLKALMGGAVALSAGGIALLEEQPIVRTYFMPPRCGWNAGSWELACATEALRVLNDRLAAGGFRIEHGPQIKAWLDQGVMNRRARLIERVDKLARGWQPARIVYKGQGNNGQDLIVHGARSGRL